MQAVDTWLKANDLTLDTIKERKALAQRVVGYLVGYSHRVMHHPCMVELALCIQTPVPTPNERFEPHATEQGNAK